MTDIRPFRAFRPAAGMEAAVASLPYDVYTEEEALSIIRSNPLSFLNIIHTGKVLHAGKSWETEQPLSAAPPDAEKTVCTDGRTKDCHYRTEAELLRTEIAKGIFIQEEAESFYLYSLLRGDHVQTGIAACVSIDDYLQGAVLRHENTREDKELDRVFHMEACRMQTGPVLLTFPSDENLKRIVRKVQCREPIYDFTSEDGVRHRVWRVQEAVWMERIRQAFEAVKAVYIADGHHRCAAAVKMGQKCRMIYPDYTGKEGFNSFLAVLFPEDELHIMAYNRMVTDLNGLSREEFLSRVAENFSVRRMPEEGTVEFRTVGNGTAGFKVPEEIIEESGAREAWIAEQGTLINGIPTGKGCFGMYLDGSWYELMAKAKLRSTDPVAALDVSVLQDYLLAPVLGIRDPRRDERIDFAGGIKGSKELERRTREDMRVAFSLFPTSMEELFAVADEGRLMPPKSTWFEPKLRSGLFLHSLWD